MIHHNSPPTYFGEVVRVPGLCYVITRFWTFALIPLVPLGTYLVRDLPDKRGNRMRLLWMQPELLEESGNLMMRIPMSLKSVLLAWLRFGCIVGASAYVLLFTLFKDRFPIEHDQTVRSHAIQDFLISVIVVAVCTAMFVFSYRLGRPSASRAGELIRAYNRFLRAKRLGRLDASRALECGIPEEADADSTRRDEG